jgi:hypothetical protein
VRFARGASGQQTVGRIIPIALGLMHDTSPYAPVTLR